ncbi:MAG TPA: carbohydrate ABC transporter substrate-binding protein, partial [Candidatus Limiplasma pullistercoris]|nr:carbohydrate ABC transporter substrate-binding protein [Candidatus Limiplasma pullistercoris]
MKKLVSLFLALILALGLSIPAMAEGTTLSVAAIETAYGSEIWQEVTAAFTELT